MKSRSCYKLYFLLALLLKLASLYPQAIKASVDRNKIVIGEQIKLSLIIDSLNVKEFRITEWPLFHDTFSHFDVADRGKIDSSVLSGLNYFKQVLTITSFDSGRWAIPPLIAAFKDPKSDSFIIRSTSPIVIDIYPANISGIKSYHDMKDIIITSTVKSGANLILLIIGVVFFAIMLMVWWINRKRRKEEVRLSDEKEIANPFEWALAQLQVFRENQRTMQSATKENYHRLYHICRKYFSLRINKEVVHFTTPEWGGFLDKMDIDKELKESFFRLLQNADDKRFAKNIPAEEFHSAVVDAEEIIKKLEINNLKLSKDLKLYNAG